MGTEESKILGKNLLEIRKEKGYSQSKIGEILGVSFQQIQKYENGINRISAEKLFHLKEIYDVPYDRFFKGLFKDSYKQSQKQTQT